MLFVYSNEFRHLIDLDKIMFEYLLCISVAKSAKSLEHDGARLLRISGFTLWKVTKVPPGVMLLSCDSIQNGIKYTNHKGSLMSLFRQQEE